MSAANVKAFLSLCESRLDLRDQVRNSQNPNRATMLNKIVAIAATENLAFTSAEYESVVQAEVETVFANHRSIFHHHVINIS